jgi:hypothetical protein
LSTLETVMVPTPAVRATSFMVGFRCIYAVVPALRGEG